MPRQEALVHDGAAGRRCIEYAERLWAGESDLAEFVSRVASLYPRSAVVLFGSRARGDHLPYSDYDVAVVLGEARDRIRVLEDVARLKPPRLPLDLVVLELGDLEDPIVRKMLTPCTALYGGLGAGRDLGCTG